MMSMDFIENLHKTADAAAAAETEFRREAARHIAMLESERTFAFRRLNLMRAVADAVARAETEEAAITEGLAALRAKLDWPRESEAPFFPRFTAVAQALFTSLKAGDKELDRGVAEALAEFEQWYASAHGAPFWTLFELPMAETPRVDF